MAVAALSVNSLTLTAPSSTVPRQAQPLVLYSLPSLVFRWLKGGGKVCCARLPGSCCFCYQHRLMLAEGLMATVLSGDTPTLTVTAPRSSAEPWLCTQ
jgi:hypothetical protein